MLSYFTCDFFLVSLYWLPGYAKFIMLNKEVPRDLQCKLFSWFLLCPKQRIGKFHPRDSFSWWINVRLRELSSTDNCLHPKVGIFSSKYQKKRVKSNLVFEKFVFMVSYLIFSVTLFFKISKKKNYMYVTCMPTMLGVEYGLFNF